MVPALHANWRRVSIVGCQKHEAIQKNSDPRGILGRHRFVALQQQKRACALDITPPARA
jgi:hypothetical protein